MKILSLIKEPWKIVTISKLNAAKKIMPDELYIRCMYRSVFGEKLNLENPVSFNEKLQWLKLHDRKPIYTTMVDKYEAKKYVASIIGEEYIIPTLGVWNHFDEIDFDSLPDQFVLKCTHDSAGIIIVRDKDSFDREAAKKKLEACLKQNFYYSGREWPYKNVKPRIIAEKYMEDTKIQELRDYKFFCFGGEVKCFKIDYDRFISHKANYYSPDGEILKIGEEICSPDFSRAITIPPELEKMEELASLLSKNTPFLRVDFYDVDGKIYFGELTFFPASGFGKFIYEQNDTLLGLWLKLPDSAGRGRHID